MLSQPNCYFFGSFARNPSNISLSTFSCDLPAYLYPLILSTISCGVFSYLSQTPSQPMIRNSSSLHSYSYFMSGYAITACRFAGSYLLRL